MVLLARKRFLMRLRAGEVHHTHRGLIHHDLLIGQSPGVQVKTHLGHSFVALAPSLHDVIMSIQRISQIVYPKDLGYILLKLNVGAGSQVIECGTGSGALTIALAHAVRPSGRVFSYDMREDMIRVASKNLENAGYEQLVEMKQRDVAEAGFDERDVDAVFLDVRRPWHLLKHARHALTEGGFLGAIVPTTNQVSELVAVLEETRFRDVEVCELLLRGYKPVPERLRPMDRMVAHTGFLVFARRLADQAQVETADEDSEDQATLVDPEGSATA